MVKIIFKKSISRDTTLFTQGIWASGLVEELPKILGRQNPFLPLTAHFVNNGMVEIWENEKAVNWFLDRLLEKKELFFKKLLLEYKKILKDLEKYQVKKSLSGEKDIRAYSELFSEAVLHMTIFFYAGSDERGLKKVKELAVRARRAADLFAVNDSFIRKNIARLGNFSEDLAGMVLADEMASIPSSKILKKRLKSFLLIDGQKKFLGSLEAFMKKNSRYEFEKEAVPAAAEIIGKIAYQGIASGYVRIVRRQSDIVKVKKGDIMVATMTAPNFLPAMKLASAFVTDEGGITCHAAIIARELKKPCIIGTKIATKVLHDGDLVEVDADKGFVKIIK